MAIHEVGRAVVAQVLHEQGGRIEGVERVSIRPRGDRLSRTHFVRVADHVYDLPTSRRLVERVQVLVAGEWGLLGRATACGGWELCSGGE